MQKATETRTVSYTPHPDVTPELEAQALGAVYKFILFDSQGEKAAGSDGGEEDRCVEAAQPSDDD